MRCFYFPEFRLGKSCLPVICLLSALLSAAPTSSQGAVNYRELLRSGHEFADAPGLKVQKFLSGFSFPNLRESINEHGDVLCVVPLTPVDGSDPGGVLEGLVLITNGSPASPRLLVKSGDPLPGASDGAVFVEFSTPGLTDDGRVVFRASLNDFKEALVSWKEDQWEVLARTGEPAAGLPEHNLVTFYLSETVLRPDGGLQFPFRARADRATPFSQVFATWAFSPSAVLPDLLVQEGGPAPDPDYFSQGEILSSIYSVLAAAAPSEHLLVHGFLSPFIGSINDTNGIVLWSGPSTNLHAILQSGVTPPDGLTTQLGEVTFSNFSEPGINGAGDVSVIASWFDDGPGGNAILRRSGGVWSVVARVGDPMPEFAGGNSGPLTFIESQRINRDGQIIFIGWYDDGAGSQKSVIRWDPDHGLKTLARSGSDWPGLPGNWSIQSLALNGLGQAAVTVVGSFGRAAIYVTGTNDDLELVAYNGNYDDPSTPPDSNFRSIAALFPSTSGGEDGRRRVMNSRGELVLPVEFHDGFDAGESALMVAQVDYGWFSLADGSSHYLYPMFSDSFLSPRNPFRAVTAAPTAPTDWDGGTLRGRILTPAGAIDLTDRIDFPTIGTVFVITTAVYADATQIGTYEAASTGEFLMTFNANATPAHIAQLLSKLAVSVRFLEDLQADLKHLEAPRELVVELEVPGMPAVNLRKQILFPRYIRPDLAYFRAEDDDHGYFFAEAFFSNDEVVSISAPEWLQRPTIAAASSSTVIFTPEGERLSFRFFKDKGTIARHIVSVELAGRKAEYLFSIFNACPVVWALSFFTGELYDLADSQIRLEYLGTDPAPGTASIQSPKASLQDAAADTRSQVQLYYTLRDWMNRSAEGRRLVALYYQFSPEILGLLVNHPELTVDASRILSTLVPGVIAFEEGTATSFTMTQAAIDQINALADEIIALASPELAAAITAERNRFNNLQDFVGKNMAEWGQLLGIGAPTEPFISLSAPARMQNGFQTTANRIAGFNLALWRTMDPAAGNWQLVTQPGLLLDNHSVILSDTNAPNDRFFYRVQASQSSATQ